MSRRPNRIKSDDPGFPVLMAQPSPRATGSARSAARRGVRLSDGRVVALPAGVTESELRLALSEPPAERQPPNDGRPVWADEAGRYVLPADDAEGDNTTTEIEMSDSYGTPPPGDLVELREATRQCRNLMGNVPIIRHGDKRYVRRADLDRFAGRGNRTGGQGAGERIAGAIGQAQDDRARAFAAARRREASDAGRRRAGR